MSRLITIEVMAAAWKTTRIVRSPAPAPAALQILDRQHGGWDPVIAGN